MAAGDTALWLHNKLGSTDDLWSGKTICAQLSQDKLQSIRGCFHTLQPHVKVKLMMSFLHIPRRNVDSWKGYLEEILMMAIHDTDQWVSMVGEILRTYPATGGLNLELEDNNGTFAEVLADLKKLVRKSMDVKMLPMECQFLNKTALLATTGQQPLPTKHFALKRKPKSATLRAELLQKSSEAALNKKRNGSESLPIKVRSFAKKMEDDSSPITGMPGKNSGSGGFLSPNPVGRRTSLLGSTSTSIGGTPNRMNQLKKEGGIKLLEMDEVPLGAKEAKRRKKAADAEAMEQMKKDREAAKALAQSAAPSPAPYTPDYAAGLISPATPMVVSFIGVSTAPTISMSQTVTYVPASTVRLPQPTPVPVTSSNASTGPLQARDTLQQQLQQLGQSQIRTQTLPPIGQTFQQAPVNQAPPTPQPLQPIQPQTQNNSQPVMGQPQQPQQAKKALSLTKDQMLEAQEMFKNSNKVTRPEKALILGFMAGSRENPCPQQGHVLSIRLNEAKELVSLGEQIQKYMLVDTFFQMNYQTGEWKRVKKYREIEAG
ncbi:negative elongation factor A-like [Dreissena polymorpha]|nr:negative elongation factor A-like [Dreissena polymorpha]